MLSPEQIQKLENRHLENLFLQRRIILDPQIKEELND